MRLYLVRHARAEAQSPGGDDASRALTQEGIRRLLRVRDGLRALGFAPDRILHSPWLRAAQTAERLATPRSPTEVHPGLAQPPETALVRELAERRAGELCCVGHEPWLSELAGLLCQGERHALTSLELKKAGAVLLEGELALRGMRLVALLPPRLLRRLRSR